MEEGKKYEVTSGRENLKVTVEMDGDNFIVHVTDPVKVDLPLELIQKNVDDYHESILRILYGDYDGRVM